MIETLIFICLATIVLGISYLLTTWAGQLDDQRKDREYESLDYRYVVSFGDSRS
jgi:hypothetical protein